MRLRENTLGFVVNFLLGSAWAFMLIGAATSFLTSYHNGLFTAIISSFIGALPGLISVLLLEHIITSKEKYYELQKQTKLLEKIYIQSKNK